MKYLFIFLLTIPLYAQKEIVVDLTQQKAYALEDGYILFEGRISSGKKGRETPEGTYRILQKKRKHRSNLWPKPNGGAKMPYMLRLTNTGIAIHLGNTSRRAASHGCIRTQNGFAQKLYKWAKVGTLVRVNGNAFNYDYMIQSSSTYGSDYGVIDFHH
ncbi:MAG: Unknown protein [uncultured Sulfurovum sp.]|uniref:L,D-TPase catalytic domain-containing protein n=1 Tax=uncultured Sulfurovum sp. TaxID=269237 RepID=A0A6S6TT56_9BACT|nr:MAG: Unknown protein [uncultured Sulfurovum sp.]